jgi:HrpA-like RNA helicase
MLDCPPTATIETAMRTLRELNVLNDAEKLTPLGEHVSRVPADVRVGKMLVYGAMLSCLDPIATVAACHGLRSPFISPVAQRQIAAEKHARFVGKDRSDLLAYVNAFDEWVKMRTVGSRAEKAWCEENFVSATIMNEVRELRVQYVTMVNEMGLAGSDANANSSKLAVVKAALCAGTCHIFRCGPFLCSC